jgi:hypothetical protein
LGQLAILEDFGKEPEVVASGATMDAQEQGIHRAEGMGARPQPCRAQLETSQRE